MLASPGDSGLSVIIKGTVLIMTYNLSNHQYSESEQLYYLSHTGRLMFDHPIGLCGMKPVRGCHFTYRRNAKEHVVQTVIAYPNKNLTEHKLRFHKRVMKTLKRMQKQKLLAQQDLRIGTDERFVGVFGLTNPIMHLPNHRAAFISDLRELCKRYGLVVGHWERTIPEKKK